MSEIATSPADGQIKCVQVTIPESSGCPIIHLQIVFLYPSTSIMLWFSLGGSGRMGTTSMAIPMPSHMPATSTRLTGHSAADTTDRLAKLLCRKYARQFFVSASLPRSQLQIIGTHDGTGEEVVTRKVMVEVHRIMREEKIEHDKNNGSSISSEDNAVQSDLKEGLRDLKLQQ